MKPSQGVSHVQVLKKNKEVSIYDDALATPHDVAVGVARLKASFSSIDNGFMEMLAERLSTNKFSANRLKEAIGNVIDTHKWKNTLTIADIIGFDKKIKLYTYNDYAKEVTSYKASDRDFVQHWVEGTLFFVKKNDCEMCGFTPNEKKK